MPHNVRSEAGSVNSTETVQASATSSLLINNNAVHGSASLLSLPSELLRQVALELRWRNIAEPSDPSEHDFTLSAAMTRFNVNRFDVCSFLRTSRKINESCESVLYEAIEICMKNRAKRGANHDFCGGSLPHLLRTLESRLDLAPAVKALALNFDTVAEEWKDDSEPRNAAHRLFQICRNIHSLYSDRLPSSFLVDAGIRGLKALAMTFRASLFIPTLSWHLGDLENLVLEDVYFNESDAFSRLALPRLKHLSLLRCLQQGATLFSSALSLPAESLQELFIHKLEDTSSHYRLFQHIQLYGTSLKSLTLCGAGLIESINSKTPEIWERLPSLRVLVISRDHFSKMTALWDHLPSTLTTLILADMDDEDALVDNDHLTSACYVTKPASRLPSHIYMYYDNPDDGQHPSDESFAEFGTSTGILKIAAKNMSSRHPHSTYSTHMEIAMEFTVGEDNGDLGIQYQTMAW
ncbi:hypothetical protein CALVIDRAFT_337351 [Calocera viscosa TUFC12733]|uniref:Uncharacterized protein n=1 Tax=Calocera viscosa (strain TUFC12733) TaxID=1330018 RepID=A0A167HJS0_CALVF|nr:hypothetical protein CALVIDRAFT_337351 [Calocera viscosa TUFC12733]